MKSTAKARVTSQASSQLHLDLFAPSHERSAIEWSREGRGAVFTRPEVVDFILDLVGYTANNPLHTYRLLEPSGGEGDFLITAVERLLTAWRNAASEDADIVAALRRSVCAIELDMHSYEKSKSRLADTLEKHGVGQKNADQLIEAWLRNTDFLLAALPHQFTHIVGNPPYVRQERIPNELLREYRARYSTMYDRADLYIPFIERSLKELEQGGVLGFICADRWVKNKYGGPLRGMIARSFHVTCYIDMVGTNSFHSEVSAYPAIFTIRRENPAPTRIARKPRIDSTELSDLARALTTTLPAPKDVIVRQIASGSDPWFVGSAEQMSLLRRLESEFPPLEETGCTVGIGVATGADRVFIAPFDGLDVEPDRKLRLATTKDIRSGTVHWQGLGVINPFAADGSLVGLSSYPKLAAYLEQHAAVIKRRNCAQRTPRDWFRTIDRIYPELSTKPKLLVPDIKGRPHVVYEPGELYPHHNLYYVTSTTWDLRALQAVLLSEIAAQFVAAYSTRMRGGYLRYQAQYLRRIRLPHWESVHPTLRERLRRAAMTPNTDEVNAAARELYRVSPAELAAPETD